MSSEEPDKDSGTDDFSDSDETSKLEEVKPKVSKAEAMSKLPEAEATSTTSGNEVASSTRAGPKAKDNLNEQRKKKDDEELGKTKKPAKNISLKKSDQSLTETKSADQVDQRNLPKQGELHVKQPADFFNICNAVVILLVLAFACIIVAIVLAPPEPEIKTDFDFVKIFENKLMELQSLFTNQTDRFWRIVKNRGIAHLRNTNPPQPLVLLLGAPPSAHGVVDCLATILAKALDPRHKRALAMIDGTEEKSFPGEKIKKKMDELLITKFKAGHRVALVHHLELLPPPSPLLFYSYCDDQNAPHKHVAIIFTVHLPTEPDVSLSPKEAEGTVEKYLSSEVWAKEDQDAVAALLSRVADTVALMSGEASDSVKASCP